MRRVLLALTALAATTLIPPAARAAPTGYVEMSDGVVLAVNVRVPGPGAWPTILVMDGYEGATVPSPYPYFETGNYASVHVSIRGTGCSGGQFNLFDRRHAMDGYEIVEWIARQPWSDGNVGIWGHSYSGLTGFLVAATAPPHLRAVSVSGLIDDLYRGIAYQGGIQNTGFPAAWLVYQRPTADILGGSGAAISQGDQTCAANVIARQPSDPMVDALAGFYGQQTDGPWWQYRNLLTYGKGIKVPTQIVQTYQDEQTGPRGGPSLFEQLGPDSVTISDPDAPGGTRTVVPKRLLMMNGDHATAGWAPPAFDDRMRWMDRWLRGADNGIDREPRVMAFLEMLSGPQFGQHSGTITADDFPLPQTQWQRYYLRSDGVLSPGPPTSNEAPDAYATGSPRRFNLSETTIPEVAERDDLPDQVVYRTGSFTETAAIVGPIAATLHISSNAPDMDLWVQISDVGPDGARMPLQRGLLRASHRALDTLRSDYTPAGDIYRPHHPHTNPRPITPGEIVDYVIEVYPLGHVIRPGHHLEVAIHTPPLVDDISLYTPLRPTGINEIHHSPARLSSILLPFVPVPVDLGPPVSCGTQAGIRCLPAD